MAGPLAIEVDRVSHHYQERQALDNVSLAVEPGEVFAFLGPNGGGKTTLFRLLSTLIPLESGAIHVLGHDVAADTRQVRSLLGVVFQAPSLDRKLSVMENMRHQGHLYGLRGAALRNRTGELLVRLGLADRSKELCEKLSGGLRRRVELAKGLLHRPRVLLMDEPSTGLDPGARRDLWDYLKHAQATDGVTVVLTTHLLEEADQADRLAILHRGRIVALDTPQRLRSTVGGDTIRIESLEPTGLAAAIEAQLGCRTQIVGDTVRLEQPRGEQWVAKIMDTFGNRIQSITLGKPTLEDVFISRTGHRLWDERQEVGVG